VLDNNFPATRDTFTVTTNTLAEGTYRLIIEDNDVRTIVDTSNATFTIHTPSIAQFDIASNTPFEVGQSVSFTTTLQCIDTIHVERLFDDGWREVEAEITPNGAARTISYTLPCPQNWNCSQNEPVKVWLRLVSNVRGVAPMIDSLLLAVPAIPLTLTPDSTDTSRTRNRLLTWESNDFDCPNLTLNYSFNGGTTWSNDTIVTNDGEDSIQVPITASGRVLVRLCCDGSGTVCDYGITGFEVGELPAINFVAPNPFNPNRPVSDYGNGAAIIYRLQREGTVRVTIYDASRTVTRVLADGENRDAGTTYAEIWDGRNGQGEIVANGTYICIIESNASERIVLPIIVLQ
jgi:hypothetical protein